MDEHSIYTQMSEDKKENKVWGFCKGNDEGKGSYGGRDEEEKVIYGSDYFVKFLKEQFKIDAIIKRRGRPRKVIEQ
ncbi:MAG: hypothetical protein SV062_13675 [Thermodesulfobacteriota bacterium]|nr:hypothetical protein [Thermodesulfobacteriota bacterium]